MQSDVLYWAVVLDEDSAQYLKELTLETESVVKNALPNFKIDKTHCHHMTIVYYKDFEKAPSLVEWCQNHEGEDVCILGSHFGSTDNVWAIKTIAHIANTGESVPCNNENPHITLATINGGKPFESNNITRWTENGEYIELFGYVTAIKK